MGDLTTLENVKAWLRIDVDTDDAVLSRLISAVSRFVEEELNRFFALQAYTDICSGNGSQELLLRNYPATSVSSVFVDGVEIPAAAVAGEVGWMLENSTIYLTGCTFTKGRRNVSVSYQAGFAVIPEDVEQATIALIARKYKERDRIGQASKSVGGEVVSYIVNDMRGEIQAMLANYRRPSFL